MKGPEETTAIYAPIPKISHILHRPLPVFNQFLSISNILRFPSWFLVATLGHKPEAGNRESEHDEEKDE
jgi:hypothetical protein